MGLTSPWIKKGVKTKERRDKDIDYFSLGLFSFFLFLV